MRIIGGKDYYDGAIAHGRDLSVVFVRKGERVFPDEFPVKAVPLARIWNPLVTTSGGMLVGAYGQRWSFTTRSFVYQVLFHTVIFCGERYGCAELQCRMRLRNETIEPSKFFYSYHGLLAELASKGVMIKDGRAWEDRVIKLVRDHFELETTEAEKDALVERGVVVAVRTDSPNEHDGDWRINGDSLKDVAFAKVIPPYEAFQEISMWVGGVLAGPPPDMVNLTDEERAEKHGMDKWSFRKKVR